MVIQLLMRHHRHSATKRSRQFYASGIENPARTRPSDKVLNALRDKEISDPTPSDDAHTMDFTTSRDSGRTAGSSGSAREIEMHGW